MRAVLSTGIGELARHESSTCFQGFTVKSSMGRDVIVQGVGFIGTGVFTKSGAFLYPLNIAIAFLRSPSEGDSDFLDMT